MAKFWKTTGRRRTIRGRVSCCAVAALLMAACSGPGTSPRAADGPDPRSVTGSNTPPRGDRGSELRAVLEGIDCDGREARLTLWGRAMGRSEAEAASALADRGEALARRGGLEEALELYARAYRTRPDLRAAALGLGRTLRQLGLTEEGAAVLRAWLGRDRPDAEALHELATAAQSLGRHGEAEAAWERASTFSPDDGTYLARRAALAALRGDSVAAGELRLRAAALGAAVPGGLLLSTAERDLRPEPRSAATAGLAPRFRLDPGSGTAQVGEISAVGWQDEFVVTWVDQREGGVEGEVRTGIAVSLDGGASWSETLYRPGQPPPEGSQADPMTAVDPRTGDFWVGGLHAGTGAWLYVSRKPSGTTILDAPVQAFDGFADKPLMVAGPRPGAPNATSVYIASVAGVQRSLDLGQTWSAAVPLGSDPEIGAVPRIGPDGTLYVVTWDLGFDLNLFRSTDGGQTVTGPTVVATKRDTWGTQDSPRTPGLFRVANIPGFALDPQDGTLYCVFHDTTSVSGGEGDVDVYLTRSDDGGTTWTAPAVLNGDGSPAGDQFLPWIEVDGSGRLHVLFFDTRDDPRPDASTNAQLDLTHAVSDDRGATWTETRLTPASFASTDAIWPGDFLIGQFLGDYLGIAVGGETVLAIYPDAGNGDLDLYAQPIGLGLFSDGFETGDLGAWSATAP